MITCKICNRELASFQALGVHLKYSHKNCCGETYYATYIKQPNEGICVCGKPCGFISLKLGYHKYCSHQCQVENTAATALKTKELHFGKGKFHSDAGLKAISKANKANKETRIKKLNETNLKKYGTEWASQNKTVKEKVANTNIQNCGNACSLHGSNQQKTDAVFNEKFGCSNPMQNAEIKAKREATNLERYGASSPFGSTLCIEKRKQNYFNKTGYFFPAQNPDNHTMRRKAYLYDGAYFDSSWELAFYMFHIEQNHDISAHPAVTFEYEHAGIKHNYMPDFILDGQLTEIKGPQFFNESGEMINPFDRSQDALYEAKHQCMLKNNVKIITDCAEYIDYVNEKYTSDYLELFNVKSAFPYPTEKQNPTHDDVIRKYHKSIWHAKRFGMLSPFEAWQDKALIKKCAMNRLKYVKHCDPDSIRQGFNVMKLAPKVSVFKPLLAKRIIETYLAEFETIFDPFSGFSGRMYGAYLCSKKYIGQDINETHVKESNELIHDYNMNATVVCKDIFESEGEYECLFTCSPYHLKEVWNEHETDMSCDEWIDECLKRFKCKRYVFVVDETEKYKDRIVEMIENKSHFGANSEKLLVIDV